MDEHGYEHEHKSGHKYMEITNMKKLITAAIIAAFSFSGTAAATDIFIDVGVDYDPNGAPTAAGGTTTGWKEELTLKYQSASTVQDVNMDGMINAGDTIISRGGLVDANTLGNNHVTGLIESEVLGVGPSNNGYGPTGDWLLSFRFADLAGTHNGDDFIYNSGTIEWLLFDTTHGGEVHLFDLEVTGGAVDVSGLLISGDIGNFDPDGVGTVNGVAVGNIFNTALGGFDNGLNVRFVIDQNANQTVATYDAVLKEFDLANTGHDGSVRFDVPEPASIAMLGLGLLGFAGASRRKSK